MILLLAGKIWPRAEPPRSSLGAPAGEPLDGIWCGRVVPHYLAGLRKVPVGVPALALAPGREFFVTGWLALRNC